MFDARPWCCRAKPFLAAKPWVTVQALAWLEALETLFLCMPDI